MGRKRLDSRRRHALRRHRLVCTFFARQEWSATAITDRPTVNMLGDTIPNSGSYAIWTLKPTSPQSTSLPPWMKRIKSSSCSWPLWDTRRDFWLQNGYHKQRQSGNARADAAMLNDLINNIRIYARRCGQEH